MVDRKDPNRESPMRRLMLVLQAEGRGVPRDSCRASGSRTVVPKVRDAYRI